MSDAPCAAWLTIVGIGEDGVDGLPLASREALAKADLIMGSRRHLSLLPEPHCDLMEWPVPFSDGIPLLLAQRGRRVVMLVSSDPFWFGAGATIIPHLDPGEWTAHPAPSTFSLAAARLGWSLNCTECLGLHAAPLSRLRRTLHRGQRILVLLRDGPAVRDLASYLGDRGFGASGLHILEALGGPRERVRQSTAETLAFTDIAHPVAVAIEVDGLGEGVPQASGLPDALFEHDGQITKRPIRALTLSALAPRPGEMLWDIGTGSGSIAIEWLLSHGSTKAWAFEADAVRAARARANAAALGVDRLEVTVGRAPDVLPDDGAPAAVFIGGGLSEALLDILWQRLASGTRLVANAVTIESEMLLARWHAAKGGTLLRLDLSEAAPLGMRRSWRASYPVVQWSVVL